MASLSTSPVQYIRDTANASLSTSHIKYIRDTVNASLRRADMQ